jgi:hypothetical protein
MRIELTGRVFGRLTVIGLAGRSPGRQALWLCSCGCGSETVVLGQNLRRGHTRSCGCGIGGVQKHGHARGHVRLPTREYRSWQSMKDRCLNPNAPKFRHWGGRGITVCDRWLSFEAFLSDMGPRPLNTSLDRVDNDGNYEPGNCRWASAAQQNANRRRRVQRAA